MAPTGSFDEIGRRHKQAQSVVALVYLGIPVVFLALVLWISYRASFTWLVGLPPLALLVLGWHLRGKHRYKPSRWAGVGGWFGVIAGVVTLFTSTRFDLGWTVSLFVPTALLGLILGRVLGRYAERLLLVPLNPELADTQYELVFRLRGVRLTALTIGSTSVTLQARAITRSRGSINPDAFSRSYPLAAITGVHDVTLTGAERLRFPITLPLPPIGTAGPAMIVQTKGDDWVLPLNQATAIAQLITRRASGLDEPGPAPS